MTVPDLFRRVGSLRQAAPEELIRRGILALAILMLATIPLTFSTQIYDQFELPQELLLRLIIPLMLALWMARLASSPTWAWQRTSFDVVVILWAGWLLIKTIFSVSPALSWRGEYDNRDGTLTQLHYIALYFLVTQNLHSWDEARRLIRAIVLGSVIACTYVLFQASGLDFLSWIMSYQSVGRFSGTLGNPLVVGTLAMLAIPLTLAFLRPRRGSEIRRSLLILAVVSTAGVLLWSALFLFNSGVARFVSSVSAAAAGPSFWIIVLFLVLTLVQGVFAHMNRLAAARKLVCVGLSVLFLRTLLESGSRGGVLGVFGGGMIALAIALAGTWEDTKGAVRVPRSAGGRTLRWIGIPALIVAVVLITLSGTTALHRTAESFQNPRRAYAESRLAIWRPALQMWKVRPLTGWGVDSFMTVFTSFQLGSEAPDQWKGAVAQTAHCEPLNVLATLGLVGLGLWIALFTVWFRVSYRKVATADGDARLVLVSVWAAVVAYLIQGLVGITAVPVRAVLWTLLAVPLANVRDDCRLDPADSRARQTLQVPGWLRMALWPVALVVISVAVASVVSAYNADLHHSHAYARFRWTEKLGREPLFSLVALAKAEMANLENRRPLGDQPIEEQYRELQEAGAWLDTARQRGLDNPERVRSMERNHAALVFLLSSAHFQGEAVRLVPREARYLGFLGEVYTELYRWSSAPEWQDRWFERADSAYRRADDLNSHNAFTIANRARLWYLRYERGREAPVFEQAARLYLRAIEIAPVNLQFISDLVALYLSAGRSDEPFHIVSLLEARDPRLAGALLLDMGKRFAAVSNTENTGGRDVAGAAARNLALEALRRAGRLRPDLAEIPYQAALIHCGAGEIELCRSLLARAFAIDPDYAPGRDLRRAKGW